MLVTNKISQFLVLNRYWPTFYWYNYLDWADAIWFLPFRKSPTFNKEVYVDFVAAQIKTLSFLAYIIRIYQDMVNTYSQNMVGGMLGLLRYCPQEVAHLRKELLIAARHILATDLRNSE